MRAPLEGYKGQSILTCWDFCEFIHPIFIMDVIYTLQFAVP